MRPDQEKIKTEIEPEHQDHDGGQASIHIKAAGMSDVNGKAPGKHVPGHCGKGRAWKLPGKSQPAVWNEGIHQGEQKRHHAPGKKFRENAEAAGKGFPFRVHAGRSRTPADFRTP